MVPCEDFKTAGLIQWFSLPPKEQTSVVDEGYCTFYIKFLLCLSKERPSDF